MNDSATPADIQEALQIARYFVEADKLSPGSWGDDPRLKMGKALLALSETPPSRDAVIEEVAKHIEASPLTYFGPDPIGVRDLRYLIIAAIRDMKGA